MAPPVEAWHPKSTDLQGIPSLNVNTTNILYIYLYGRCICDLYTKTVGFWDFLVVWWLRPHISKAGELGFDPHWGTRTQAWHTVQPTRKTKILSRILKSRPPNTPLIVKWALDWIAKSLSSQQGNSGVRCLNWPIFSYGHTWVAAHTHAMDWILLPNPHVKALIRMSEAGCIWRQTFTEVTGLKWGC